MLKCNTTAQIQLVILRIVGDFMTMVKIVRILHCGLNYQNVIKRNNFFINQPLYL